MQSRLRFLVYGSSDAGRSTLVAHLVEKSRQAYRDELRSVTKKSGSLAMQDLSFAIAPYVDGVLAESEQGPRGEISWQYFSTPKRQYIVGDALEEEPYTYEMIAGASTLDAAALVVSATKEIELQTYHHIWIASLLRIRHLLIVVNKMDLVGWAEEAFSRKVDSLKDLRGTLGFETFYFIPVSALYGDNLTERSNTMPWYSGRPLISYLEDLDFEQSNESRPFRMVLQSVKNISLGSRGLCGRVTCGEIRTGDRVRIVPSGVESKISAIYLGANQRAQAGPGQSVTICLDQKIDVIPGAVIAAASDPPEVSDQFEAQILCLSEQHLLAGRSYLFRLHTCEAVGTVTTIKYKVDLQTGIQLAASDLRQNDIGVVNLALDRPVPFEPYDRHKELGSLVLMDRFSNRIVGAGMIQFALRRAANIHFQAMEIDKAARARQKLQSPLCLWFTGLPSSGKSTIANLLEKRLFATGRHTYTLDGDNIRHGLNRDLGFSEADRVENIRRVTEIAHLMVDAGLVVIVSFISPFRAEREAARLRFGEGEFLEVFVDTPLVECERRDPKGLYAKARRGELANFTGIDSVYEAPISPEIWLDTVKDSAEECVEHILRRLEDSLLKSRFEQNECFSR